MRMLFYFYQMFRDVVEFKQNIWPFASPNTNWVENVSGYWVIKFKKKKPITN